MRHVVKGLTVLACCLVWSLAFWVMPSLATVGAPQWTVTSVSRPTNFALASSEAAEDSYKVTVTNTGGAPSNGEPVVITEEPPEGLLESGEASGEDALALARREDGEVGANPTAHFSCVFRECTYSAPVEVGDTLIVSFPVEVTADAGPLVRNVVRVSGGGAAAASMSTPTTISQTPANFGLSPGGTTTAFSSTQAGAHPDFTTSLAFNTVNGTGSLAGEPREVTDDLPPGFAGDLVDTPACSAATFTLRECPIDTQVGITTLTVISGVGGTPRTIIETLPVYNLTPNSGELAKVGFAVGTGGEGNVGIQGNVSIRSDYGLETKFYNIDQNIVEIDSDSLTIWGVPASSIHDALRFRPGRLSESGGFGASSEVASAPFFTNPTSCGTGLEARIAVTSWEQQTVETAAPFGAMVGCDRLTIEPSLTAEVSTNKASAPTGFDLGMNIPQTYGDAEGISTSTLEDAAVTLPEGMTVNPSAGAGLAGCTPEQYAEEGPSFVSGRGCPNESKLGTIRIVSPSLKEEVSGSVFLAQPYDNLAEFGEAAHPFGSLLALYVVARIPARGLLVKFAGRVEPNFETGRLVTTFHNLPPLPFSHALFSFIQGPTSPLVSPPTCGQYVVHAVLTPYSDPLEELSPPIPPFAITQGVDGGPCPSGGVPPFNPQVVAGTENNDAASFSPFYVRIAREDGEQEITKFTTILPPGLTGDLTGIPFCSEVEIEAAREATGTEELAHPSCPTGSEIGHTIVGVGVGTVLAQNAGKIYLAGPYHGSALSIVSVTAAKVGPFDLGTVVIRFALRINPTTAQVEVDGGASDPIPHIIDGIVVHVRDIRVYVDKHDFTLNPTSCDPMSITNAITGAGADPAVPADQATVTITSQFQAADCQNLKFTPAFKVSTSGKTSRVEGASLTANLAFPAQALGSQANIRSVKVDLPKQLPSRLTTLAEGVHSYAVRCEPGGVSDGVSRRTRQGDHSADPCPARRSCVLREPWRGSVPELDRRVAGLRHHDRSRWYDIHQQSRDHEQHVQGRPRPARRFVRAGPSTGQVLRSCRQRQSVQDPTSSDADGIHRAERRGDPQFHADRRNGSFKEARQKEGQGGQERA